MKKKIYAVLGLVFCTVLMVRAQTGKRFDFSYINSGTYLPLSSSAVVLGFEPDWDDTVSEEIALPFDFYYQGEKVLGVTIETYGSLILNIKYQNSPEAGNIIGINSDYMGDGRGKIAYETTGNAPSRIFKVEYQNVAFYNDNIPNTDTANSQIWLYEGSNIIEYRAGYCNADTSRFVTDIELEDGDIFMFSGLLTNDGTQIVEDDPSMVFQYNYAATSNTYADSTVVAATIENNPGQFAHLLMHKFPPNGSIFKYTPKSTDTTTSIYTMDNGSKYIKLYPNPTTGASVNLDISHPSFMQGNIMVMDLTGKQIFSQKINALSQKINTNDLPAGTYIVKVSNVDNSITASRKLIKK